MRLQELETRELREELKTNPDTVISRASEDIAAAESALAQAGAKLRAAKEKREAGFQKLAGFNGEHHVCQDLLRDSKTLALEGDVKPAWREAAKNRERLKELSDLITYQSLWILPADAVAVLEAEIEIEDCTATLLEAQCALDRCRMYSLTLAARGIDAGVKIDLEGSASARIMKTVERSLRDIIPEMRSRLQRLVEKSEAARQEAAVSIFG